VIEAVLRRIAHRCEIHDRPSYRVIRSLEEELGIPLSAVPADPLCLYLDRSLIDCGHAWCRNSN